MLQKRQDYFLLHPPRQPKREIANYVWRNMILVPEIFTSFKYGKIASGSGMKVRARSEHPQDYAGVSGLVDSPILNDVPYAKSEKDLVDALRLGQLVKAKDSEIRIIEQDIIVDGKWIPDPSFKPEKPEPRFERQPSESTHNVQSYFKSLGLPPSAQEEFWGKMSFSYWQELGGHNLSIIADSAIAGRYHVMVRSHDFCGCAIFEDGIAKYQSGKVPQEIMESGRKITEFYESVRNLQKFDPGNCPTIEAQLYDSEIWFLQYLRGQPFEPAAFRLERPPAKGELVAEYVRGATAPEGGLYRIRLYDINWPGYVPSYPYQNKIDGTFDISMNSIFRELCLRTWQVNMMFEQYGKNSALRDAVSHGWISRLFKPKISLIFSQNDLEIIRLMRSRGEADALVWLVSDGNKAYLKIL